MKMNPVQHFDLPVSDPVKSKGWYEQLFGWKIEEVPGMGYWMVYTTEMDPKTQTPKEPGAINGGMAKAGDVTRPYFTITVPDIDATLKAVVDAGGAVQMPKTSMGEWGAMARFTDPDGNVIGLFQQ